MSKDLDAADGGGETSVEVGGIVPADAKARILCTARPHSCTKTNSPVEFRYAVDSDDDDDDDDRLGCLNHLFLLLLLLLMRKTQPLLH